MKHGFFKLAAAVPELLVAAPLHNAETIGALIDRAYDGGAAVVTFPELCVTGATCGDLFLTDTLLDHAEQALEKIAEHTEGKKMLAIVGCPLRVNGKLFNCAVGIADGRVLGAYPKRRLSNLSGEARYFTPGESLPAGMVCEGPLDTVVSRDMNFRCESFPDLSVRCGMDANFGEWTENSGETVFVNLCAEEETVGKEDWRRTAAKAVSGEYAAAYVQVNAGSGESTTDCVYAGQTLIAMNGEILAENRPFGGDDLIFAAVDLQRCLRERRVKNVFPAGYAHFWGSFELDERETDLTGSSLIDPCPFLPQGADERAVCSRILDIQAHGLAKRIRAAYANGCVVALSGGLDSTLALIVTVKAMDLLGKDRKCITTVTMPCFGTTSRTRSNAESLAQEFGTSFRTIDIKEAVDLHFRDIGHDPNDLSVVYENSQARERTQIIMDIANADNSLVIGTGDLSELALGWATYNGDQMSNYGVNGGVPKTMVRRVVSFYADVCGEEGKTALAQVLRDVLATPVSPELLPAKDGEIAQKTEDLVGPYDLHDFFLYHFIRWGETPEKIYREAKAAFAGRFDDETIRKWLNTFLKRFHSQQFKRSALPDGPKVGSVALSPRGAWQMPSDACGWECKLD